MKITDRLDNHLELEKILSVIDLMEQTGFWRSLVFLHYRGSRSASSMREIAGSYDSARSSFSNMELLGLVEQDTDETPPFKRWFKLTENGEKAAVQFIEVLKTLGFNEPEMTRLFSTR